MIIMKESHPNIKFFYLYRDAGNYKAFGEVIFSNPDGLPLTEIESKIRASLIDGEFFDPIKWDIPKLKIEGFDYDPELDHDWMEFEKIDITKKETTSLSSITNFIGGINKIQMLEKYPK